MGMFNPNNYDEYHTIRFDMEAYPATGSKAMDTIVYIDGMPLRGVRDIQIVSEMEGPTVVTIVLVARAAGIIGEGMKIRIVDDVSGDKTLLPVQGSEDAADAIGDDPGSVSGTGADDPAGAAAAGDDGDDGGRG